MKTTMIPRLLGVLAIGSFVIGCSTSERVVYRTGETGARVVHRTGETGARVVHHTGEFGGRVVHGTGRAIAHVGEEIAD
jgi:hypothetical protein